MTDKITLLLQNRITGKERKIDVKITPGYDVKSIWVVARSPVSFSASVE
jgi:hypothetical protein